jgi:3-hydroxymyristoyl/3-hydroxydecanoyl-(acyl carrier protein) dehydratase
LEPELVRDCARRLRQGPLVPIGCGAGVAIDRTGLERLMPHRGPMLLVDGIDAVDLAASAVRGWRRLKSSDPGFDGHFPDAPIYPGVLVVEAIGQLALSLLHFTSGGSIEPPAGGSGPRVRATHIHHATFLQPFAPGDLMTLHAGVVESGLTMVAMGQAYKNDELGAYAISEVYVDH